VSFVIGIPIHNEVRNIGRLLRSIRAEGLERHGLQRVLVVSSGSTDGCDDVVSALVSEWPALELLVEGERRGKAAAVNRLLSETRGVDRLVLISGDVLPEPGALSLILRALEDPEVGMAAGRPLPAGQPRSLFERLATLQWDLHHRVSLSCPKLGEAVAWRNVVPEIPRDSAVDEAALEAAIRSRGYRLAYVPEALIFNRAPHTACDLLKQRRRIAAGHRHLALTTGYRVSTTRLPTVARALIDYLSDNPRHLPLAMAAAAFELTARVLGLYDLHLRRHNPTVWAMATTTKDPVAALPEAGKAVERSP
jgi:cellulose synthase/poly-beta-1,6-N-acetylglucosamine synthase-like glycosyltransferase